MTDEISAIWFGLQYVSASTNVLNNLGLIKIASTMNTARLAILSNIIVSGAFEDHCLKTISIRLEFFFFLFYLKQIKL